VRHSELILNADGSIYHLNLKPGDVTSTIILVGDPGRVSRVTRHFDELYLCKSKREFVTHTGRIGNKDLTVISTGIGTSNIDIVMNEIDALFNVDLDGRMVKEEVTQLTFIRVGTSGALQPGLAVDDVVSSQYALGLDAFARLKQSWSDAGGNHWFEELRVFMVARNIDFEPAYFAMADTALMEQYKSWTQPAITVTCAGFYGLQGRSLRIPSNQVDLFEALREFSAKGLQVGNLEMETAGIYLMSGLLGHRALSLSAILANRSSGTFSKDPHHAVDQLILNTLRTLSDS
jgi:uridine phosphorylase